MGEFDGSSDKNFSYFNSSNFSSVRLDNLDCVGNSTSRLAFPMFNEFSNSFKEFSFSRNQNASFSNRLFQIIRPEAMNTGGTQTKDNQQIAQIKQIPILQNSSDTRFVNYKQWYRMMKRRIKKQIDNYKRNIRNNPKQDGLLTKKPYIYESRHNHAQARPRGADGRFLASKQLINQARSIEQRVRQKKKRGRKPKDVSQEEHGKKSIERKN